MLLSGFVRSRKTTCPVIIRINNQLQNKVVYINYDCRAPIKVSRTERKKEGYALPKLHYKEDFVYV